MCFFPELCFDPHLSFTYHYLKSHLCRHHRPIRCKVDSLSELWCHMDPFEVEVSRPHSKMHDGLSSECWSSAPVCLSTCLTSEETKAEFYHLLYCRGIFKQTLYVSQFSYHGRFLTFSYTHIKHIEGICSLHSVKHKSVIEHHTLIYKSGDKLQKKKQNIITQQLEGLFPGYRLLLAS